MINRLTKILAIRCPSTAMFFKGRLKSEDAHVIVRIV